LGRLSPPEVFWLALPGHAPDEAAAAECDAICSKPRVLQLVLPAAETLRAEPHQAEQESSRRLAGEHGGMSKMPGSQQVLATNTRHARPRAPRCVLAMRTAMRFTALDHVCLPSRLIALLLARKAACQKPACQERPCGLKGSDLRLAPWRGSAPDAELGDQLALASSPSGREVRAALRRPIHLQQGPDGGEACLFCCRWP